MATAETRQHGARPADGLPAIEIYSTLSRAKAPLVTVKPGHVGIYLCGPTVYKPSHIGHMVGPVIFDTVKRHLAYSGYDVTWVVNITDVDDKIIAESTARGTTMAKLAEEMTADYLGNLAALGVTGIDEMPKATDHIGTIIAFIEGLITKGFAYASDGDVYFDVTRDPDYGKLTNRSVEQTQGEGGSTADRKRSAADFALWKKAKPGEPSWESPWGAGRPGWHIECSAMCKAILGETFDIHGGGLDLVFPHHENEIAQSESLHGKPMASFWMHNGLMQAGAAAGKVGGRPRDGGDDAADAAAQAATKISKSTGAEPFKNPRRSGSWCSPPTTAARSTSARSRSPRAPRRWRPSSGCLPGSRGSRASPSTPCPAAIAPPAMPRRPPRGRSGGGDRRPAGQVPRRDGRRLQHGDRRGHALRLRAGGQQVHRPA